MVDLPRKTRVGLISLGCPKNLVDSEVMLGLLRDGGYELVNDEKKADVMIVNTCSFIEDAEQESIGTILNVARLKKAGTLKKLIVTGCLPQRYKADLENDLPEVDHFIGTGEFQRIAEFTKLKDELPVVRSLVDKPEFVYDYATPRISTLPPHTSYVKIAEGCSRPCAFCIIPRLRGRGRSRPISSIVEEVRRLASSGALEVNLIAQDLTAYGRDREDGATLEALLHELVAVDGIRWIRLMYNYPEFFTDGLIDLIATSEKICKYLDLPLQHIDDGILQAMKRKIGETETRELISKLKSRIPNLTLRTTMLVGFPGETDAQFEKLLSYVEETRFDRLGVFTYSHEEGTVAASLPDPVAPEVMAERKERVMLTQQKISLEKNAALVGKTLPVLIDRAFHRAGGYSHVGRTEGHAIDIDGTVYVRGKNFEVGRIVPVKIEKGTEYDLFSESSI
ncbi:MAG: 30S ribosomal protein S12 methylthiotransferase RimO [Pseudomonadota bacterium]